MSFGFLPLVCNPGLLDLTIMNSRSIRQSAMIMASIAKCLRAAYTTLHQQVQDVVPHSEGSKDSAAADNVRR